MDMSIRTIARTLLAGIFIFGGWGALQKPKEMKGAAEEAGTPIAEKTGLPTDPVELVKINGAVQLGGGILLMTGLFPRLAALALAGTLVPTTMGAHRFWDIEDPAERQAQMIHALKNGSILGGLILAALDHGGRPSVFWTAGKAAERTSEAVSGAVERVTG